MTNIETAIWDWNGTLWDDVEQWFIAAKAAYAHGQIKDPVTLNRLRDVFDVPVSEVIFKLGASRDLPEEIHQKIITSFRTVLSLNTNKARVRDGAQDVLKAFNARGVVNHIASNHPLELLKAELKCSGLTDFISGLGGNENHDDVYRQAKKRDKVISILHELGPHTDPKSVCIIADTREEIRIAKEFGLVSIAITGGYNSERVLQDAEPTHLVHSLSDVRKLVAK